MRYIISDIHGCKKEYLELLRKIKFSDEDHLYILGDVLDRGEDPIGVLLDVMNRKNVTLIMGNHEHLFYSFLKTLGLDFSNFKSEDEKWDFRAWLRDGGLSTFEGYLNLTQEEKKSIYDYIGSRKAYAALEYEEKKYILVHAGIANFDEKKRSINMICRIIYIKERIIARGTIRRRIYILLQDIHLQWSFSQEEYQEYLCREGKLRKI